MDVELQEIKDFWNAVHARRSELPGTPEHLAALCRFRYGLPVSLLRDVYGLVESARAGRPGRRRHVERGRRELIASEAGCLERLLSLRDVGAR